MISAAELRQRLREAGRRVTPQRDLIFRLLEETQADHPSAEMLHLRAARQMPSISLRTVYAVLAELQELAVVRPLDLGTGSTRFCTNVRNHHHLVCERCGRVKDVFMELASLEVPEEQRSGFLVKEQSVVFRGLCAGCRGAGA
ncbi:MAG: Fur family transcriptional regulator [Armatimonadota bacterium]|nr:Fur family transcriptional regulator [Armatimonadota bacterium]MDR7427761.1 Fur family transcriptional regulator [Armatimonadota bacterium]MDR7464677.1 Fur family transcriptional regulator [Armatimonadota bacterium]MDR7469357.1 Fur family transcriptional regulator [Armatimonadota bacterium]MDR7475911.1 Fur family transcriptional regulator [Armatimonadota bacterium]